MNLKMGRVKVFSKDEVSMQIDVQTISSQMNNLQKSFDEFVSKQEIQEQLQERRISEVEKFVAKERTLYTIRQIEIRIIYSGISALIVYFFLR